MGFFKRKQEINEDKVTKQIQRLYFEGRFSETGRISAENKDYLCQANSI